MKSVRNNMIWDLFLLGYLVGFSFFFLHDLRSYIIAAVIFMVLGIFIVIFQVNEQKKLIGKEIIFQAKLQYNIGVILSLAVTGALITLSNLDEVNLQNILVYELIGLVFAIIVHFFRRDFILARNANQHELVIISPGWIINKVYTANLTDIRVENNTLLWSVKNRAYKELNLKGLNKKQIEDLENLLNTYPKYTDKGQQS